MTALLKLPHGAVSPTNFTSNEAWTLLNRVRFLAITCRASARLDLYEACALVSPGSGETGDTAITTLLRVMEQAVDKRPVFYAPASDEMSFDESWLTAVITARCEDDIDSLAFLLRSRVAKSKRRFFAMLVALLAENLSK